MNDWTTIRTWNTANFCVALQYQHDCDPPAWERARTLPYDEAIYCFRVVVMWDGMNMGADYLGDSVYVDPNDFAQRKEEIRYLAVNAIHEARERINAMPNMRRS
jgi:hypothetical protein